MYNVHLALQCIYGCSDERGESGDGEDESELYGEGRESILTCLLYADDLALCSQLEEMVEHFVEACRRRGGKVNGDKHQVRVLGGDEGLDCKIHVDGE